MHERYLERARGERVAVGLLVEGPLAERLAAGPSRGGRGSLDVVPIRRRG